MKKVMKPVVCACGAWLLAAFACRAAAPDFFVDFITSDATYDSAAGKPIGGKIDTGYCYKGSDKTYPRTTMVSFDYNSHNLLRRPGETDGKQRAIFGVWSTTLSCFRTDGAGSTQFWTPGPDGNCAWLSSAFQKGRNTIAIDYLATNVWLNGEAKYSAFRLPSAGSDGYKLCWAENCYYSYLDVYGFKAWEQTDAGSDPALVMNLRPCCAEGRAALYDMVSKKVIFPDSDGYTLPLTNDVVIAAGGTLHVAPFTVNQKSITFTGDAALIFDGQMALDCAGKVTFGDETAMLTVSLTEARLQGDYALVTGLPTGVRAQIGEIPPGYAGEVVCSGGTLVLRLRTAASDPASGHPEAIAETLRSDAQGYVPTGYFLRTTKSPTTSRIVYEWYDTAHGKGTAPGPTNPSNNFLPVFGYWDDAIGNRLGARHNNDYLQLICKNSTDGMLWCYSGNQTVEINLNTLVNTYTCVWSTGSNVQTWTAKAYGGDDVNEIFAFGMSKTDGTGVFSKGAVYDFKAFKVWETTDGGTTETLARDFVPCWNDGKAGMWDRVTGAIRYPVADTNGFTVANCRWRLAANDEFLYLAEGEAVRVSLMDNAVGYKVVRDRDGTVIAEGSDGAVAFTMPGEPLTVRSLYDAAVGADTTLALDKTRCYRTISFGADARLALSCGARAVIDGTLDLPSDGKVTIELAGVTGVGVYTVMEGLDAAVSPDMFAVGPLPTGYAGTFEKWDDKLVLRVGWDKVGAPILVKSIQTDGIGWIDTEYFYHGDAFPKTSRVRMEAYSEKLGRNPAGNAYTSYSFFGTWDGVMTASRWHEEYLQVWHDFTKKNPGGGNNYSEGWVYTKADIVMEFDYLNAGLWMTVNGGERNTFWNAELKVSSAVSGSSMYLFGVNGNNAPGYYRFNEFRVWETPDGESETLAVDMVPCVSGGKAGVYDKVRNRVFLPKCAEGSVSEFTVPEWDMGFAQEFSHVAVESTAPATTAEFGPQNAITLTKDAVVTIRKPVTRVVVTKYVAAVDSSVRTPLVTRYDVVGEPAVYTPAVGGTLDVKLGTATKAVVTVEGGEPMVQDFGAAKVTSAAEALYRTFEVKRSLAVEHEVMIAADATLSFARDNGPAVVTRYAADGTVVSAEELTSAVKAGETYAVALGDGVAYAVVSVKLPRRGMMIFLR